MSGWTVERMHRAASHVDVTEFERKRRQRMQERESYARLYRLPSVNVSNVVPIRPSGRPPFPPYGDAA